MPKRQLKNGGARAQNAFFSSTIEEEKKRLVIPKGKTFMKKYNVRTFLNSVDGLVAESGIPVPKQLGNDVGPGAAAVFASMYRVAIRDNSEDPKIYCPKCKQWHTVEITHACPHHPEDFPDLPVRTDNVNLERNSMQVAMKIFDKFLPTLSSVDQNINIQGQITTVSAQLTQIMFKYVPVNMRKEAFQEINDFLTAVQEQNGD